MLLCTRLASNDSIEHVVGIVTLNVTKILVAHHIGIEGNFQEKDDL